VETTEMLELRGGAEKIMFVDRREHLNGKTLAEVASNWGLPVPPAVRRIMTEGNAGVMNLDLYDMENTRFLAQQEWMMTCTDDDLYRWSHAGTRRRDRAPAALRGVYPEVAAVRAG
jgi:hypothetical protein